MLVQKPALDKMNSTFVGMPVVNFEHTEKEPEELFEMDSQDVQEFADGVVAATGYDDQSGWYWADMLIWDDETKVNIDSNGYSVSCAYDVTDAAAGGSYHNVEYQEEVLNGIYKHMAVVPNPRYEDAWVILNSKPKETRVKVFKKHRQNEKDDEMKNTGEDMKDRYVMRENGDRMPLNELVAQYKEMKAEKADEEMRMNEEDIVEIDGEQISVRDMIEAVGMMKNPGDMENEDDDEEIMDNAVDPIDDDVYEVVDESRQNAKKKERAQKGKENMQKLRNAARKTSPIKIEVDTQATRIERGKARYGSVVKQEV